MQSAGRLAEIFLQQSPACQWMVSADGAFARLYGDPLPLFGRTAAELVGQIPGDVLEPAPATAWRDRFGRALQGETMLLRERRGKDLWHVTVFPLRVDGEIQYAGGSAREITPWASAEQELRHTVLGALKAQEVERARFSRFLHDSMGQNLTALGLHLDLIRMDLESVSPDTCRRIGELQKLLEEMMGSVRAWKTRCDIPVAPRSKSR